MSFVVNKSHELILLMNNKKIAIDATLGNGFDTLFLSKHFLDVHSFDIQELALKRSKEKLIGINNVNLYLDNFINIDKLNLKDVDLVLYNLGFLPGSDKKVVTQSKDTITSIRKAINMLSSNGLILINCYLRHPGGKHEYEEIVNFLSNLDNIYFSLYKSDESVDVLIKISLKENTHER